MKLTHYSDYPINNITDVPQYGGYEMKPSGLWVSDEDDYGWAEWAKDNCPDLLNDICYEITLSEDANILYLRTPEDIDAFTFCYKSQDSLLSMFEHVLAIDWQQVAKEYDGLIITPYQWSRRLGHPCIWYYGWDCASGCIWAKKAIKSHLLL